MYEGLYCLLHSQTEPNLNEDKTPVRIFKFCTATYAYTPQQQPEAAVVPAMASGLVHPDEPVKPSTWPTTAGCMVSSYSKFTGAL